MGRLARFIRFYTDEDDGNGGGKFVLKTVTGTLLHILDALMKPAVDFSVNISPQQDLHGQANPYPAGGGRNKYNPSEAQDNKWVNNTTGAIESTTGYWVTGFIPVKANDVVRFISKGSARNAWYNSDKSQSTYFAYSGGDGSVTAPEDGFVVCTVSANTIAFGGDFIVTINDSDLSYAPYSNICPITGWTGANVARTGKNLLVRPYYESRSTIANVEVTQNNDGSVTFNGTASGSMFFNFGSTNSNEVVFKTGTYTISGGDSKLKITAVKNGSYFTSTNTQTGYVTFTVEEESKIYFYASASSGTVFDNDTYYPIVEVGSSPTSYSEYTATTIPITFPDAAGTVYGGTLTNNGTDEWTLVVDRAKIVLNGTETWSKPDNCFRTNDYYSETAYPEAISSDYIVGRSYSDVNGNNRRIGIGASGSGLRVHDENFSTADNFKNYLTSHNIQLVYKLATPVTHTLTEQQALTLLKGENNVWSSIPDGQLSLTYKAQA